MAIKVGGTTVIDDSRALTNIASVDATTVAALGTAGIGGGGGIELTTSEDVVEGDTLTWNFTTGKVEKVTRTGAYGTSSLGSLNVQRAGRLAHISGDVFAIAYGDSSTNQNKHTIVRWNPSSKTFTTGTTVAFSSDTSMTDATVVLSASGSNTVVFITPYNLGGTMHLQCLAYTPDTTNLTLTSAGNTAVDAAIHGQGDGTLSATYNSNQDKIVVLYRGSNSGHSVGGYGFSRVITLGAAGNSSISVSSVSGPNGSNYFMNSANQDFHTHSLLSDGNKIVAVYHMGGDFRGVVGTLSGTSITWGSVYTFGGTAAPYYSHGNLFKHISGKYFALVQENSSNPKFVIFESNSSNNIINYTSHVPPGIDSQGTYRMYGSYDSVNNRLFYSSRYSSTVKAGVINLNTNTPTQVSSSQEVLNTSGIMANSADYNSSAEYAFYGMENGQVAYFAPEIDNFHFFVGCAKEAASANSTVKIANAGQIATGLSGLTPGTTYRINYTGGWSVYSSIADPTGFANATQRAQVNGIALTSSTMLMWNDMMSYN